MAKSWRKNSVGHRRYKGAGKAIAERLARAGATIIITARNKPEKMNVEFHYIAADLILRKEQKKVIEEIKNSFGGVDILINNLGGSETPGGGFQALTDAHLAGNDQTNLLAPVRLDRACFHSCCNKVQV